MNSILFAHADYIFAHAEYISPPSNICSPWANKDFFIVNKLLTYYNIYYQKYILNIFVNT